MHEGKHAKEILNTRKAGNRAGDGKGVITRFPPSPTGPFHVGSARTALFNYLFAQRHGGHMILRFEDTDQKRSDVTYEKDIKEGLKWLGITYDGEFRQSERTELYTTYLETLLEDGHAYISREEEGERDSVIRFKNPKKTITFEDRVRGTVEVDTTDLGDFVIAKSIEEPLYHLAVVIDDFEMGITHIIRGVDHISNTPRQILIQEAIGAPRPFYAHIPFILGPDKSKLSKRHGAASVNEYQEAGFLPEALFNYLAFLGWNPGDGEEREIFSREELVALFDLEGIQSGDAVFNIDKLQWYNKQYINNLNASEMTEYITAWIPDEITTLPQYSTDRVHAVAPLIQERIETLADIAALAENGDVEYYFERPGYFAENLLWRDEEGKEGKRNTKEYLRKVRDALEHIDKDDFNAETIKSAVWDYATEQGRGNVLWPMRYALCGVDQSPGPFELAAALGKTETLARLDIAIDNLSDE